MYSNLLKICKTRLSYSFIKESLRKYSKVSSKELNNYNEETCNELETIIDKFGEHLQYNSVLQSLGIPYGNNKNTFCNDNIKKRKEFIKRNMQLIQPLPLSLKFINDNNNNESVKHEEPVVKKTEEQIVSFPYENTDSSNFNVNRSNQDLNKVDLTADDEIRLKHEKMKEVRNWMTAYDNYNDSNIEDMEDENWEINYGTPDPNSRVSNVPCGGCGALLHCKDTAIPGYIPSEIFKNHSMRGGANLEAIICQRCYFLKNYNMALQVKVSPDEYPKILSTLSKKKALVVLMVDLMDFPCSIWPGMADILGQNMPVVIVGNKVDLLPKDDDKFLYNIKRKLLDYCKLYGFGTANIRNVALISAKTGFGVEDLITMLQSEWKFQGDVYLVGCTNVGKSSLFNALIQSDYCKMQAIDLLQRATTSLWPGTTLNLLKFPLMRPSGYRLHLRHERLTAAKKLSIKEDIVRSTNLKEVNSGKYATLIGHIGRSYEKEAEDEAKDVFSVTANSNASGKLKMGVDESHPDYALSRWCYDTPGVIQPDQIINILTADELMLTLPKHIIRPVSFCLKPGSTLFVGGLGRVDYLEGDVSVRFTVFRSHTLPLTVCSTKIADQLYKDFLGKDVFAVPMDISNRLEKWPGLEQSHIISITGINNKMSAKDIVLSSAGWVAINIIKGVTGKFVAWTPEKRGCYVRDCLLPKAVQLRGKRKRFSPVYEKHKFI
ncbi:unnamed protein product [Brassicogethes aeneus]|uniref:G domain-containing protein n=1 Tax=Brassicogethes aeneus TaxID=1431903 RepID=A0A9P0B3R9_BRAAE|nr:unnamed protein product [Brassicogethes aeneus]